MLTETVVYSTSAPPTATSTNNALLKDAGVFVQTYHPNPQLVTTFKKSRTNPNCLAYSSTHIFAAQASSSTVHVYNIEKGNQESTIPFRVRITSIALCCADSVLSLGTAEGAVILWELHTGRQVSTPASHLGAVTCLAVDMRSNFLLSGADDSNVLVWSLLDLLSFQTDSHGVHEVTKPRHTLSAHRGAITALKTGHAGASASGDIAISASKDGNAIMWDYVTGEQLRIFLLPSPALSLEIDPADRAFYAGYNDGSISCVSFYSETALDSIHEPRSTPIQPPPESHWPPRSGTSNGADVSSSPASTYALALTYDATILLSAHANGRIQAWNIATGSFVGDVTAQAGAPITNLHILYPSGWPAAHQSSTQHQQQNGAFKAGTVVKPRQQDNNTLSGAYAFQAVLTGLKQDRERTDIKRALEATFFSDDFLAESILDLSVPVEASGTARPGSVANVRESDFVPLNPDIHPFLDERRDQTEEIERLKKHILHITRLEDKKMEKIVELTQKVKDVKQELEDTLQDKAEKGWVKRREAEDFGEGLEELANGSMYGNMEDDGGSGIRMEDDGEDGSMGMDISSDEGGDLEGAYEGTSP